MRWCQLLWLEVRLVKRMSRLQHDAATRSLPRSTDLMWNAVAAAVIATPKEKRSFFLPDEVSLQANDPFDDLLLWIPRGPEGAININTLKAISIKPKQENSHIKILQACCSKLWKQLCSDQVWGCSIFLPDVIIYVILWFVQKVHAGVTKDLSCKSVKI